jgi:hypothetical protein
MRKEDPQLFDPASRWVWFYSMQHLQPIACKHAHLIGLM